MKDMVNDERSASEKVLNFKALDFDEVELPDTSEMKPLEMPEPKLIGEVDFAEIVKKADSE